MGNNSNREYTAVSELADHLDSCSPILRRLFLKTVNLHVAPAIGKPLTQKTKKDRVLEALAESLTDDDGGAE